MANPPLQNPSKSPKLAPQSSNKLDLSPITVPAPNLSPTVFGIIGMLLAIGAAIAIHYTSDLPPLIIVSGTAALFLAITIFQRPELGAYILIFSVFTNLSDLFTEKGLPSINKPLVALVIFSIFANYILRTGKLASPPKITRIEALLAIYLLAVLGSSFVAVDQPKALSAISDLIKDIAVGYCIFITLDSKEKIKAGLGVLLFAVTFAAILGVIHTITGTSNTFWGFAQNSIYGQISDSDGQLRYAGPLGESNVWGQVLVAVIPIAIYMFAKSRKTLVKFFPAAACGVILLAMFFTESRGATLALAAITILIIIDLKIKRSALFLIASGMVLLVLIIPSKYTERIMSLNIFFQNQEYGYTNDESINGRRAKMLVGLAMFAENPFLGVGFANYSDNYLFYGGSLGLDSSTLTVGEDATSNENQAHSLYVEILAETGIFGFASFITFLGLIISGLYYIRKNTRFSKNKIELEWSMLAAATMVSIITFLIAGFFLHGIGFRFIWVLIGLGLTFIQIDRKQTFSNLLT